MRRTHVVGRKVVENDHAQDHGAVEARVEAAQAAAQDVNAAGECLRVLRLPRHEQQAHAEDAEEQHLEEGGGGEGGKDVGAHDADGEVDEAQVGVDDGCGGVGA